MSEETKEVKVKRPNKAETVAFLGTLGSFVLNKVPGFPEETFINQARQGGFKLYEEELESVVALIKKGQNKDLNGSAFIDLCHRAGIVIEGERPAFGGHQGTGPAIKINSRERAEEVVTATTPGAVDAFMEIMSGMLSLKKDADVLIKGKAEISIAIKNVGEYVKKREVKEVTEGVPEAQAN